MEEMRITQHDHDVRDEDFDELNLLINGNSYTTISYMDPMDDEHAMHLRINAETDEVIGAMILWANDWFKELADAFQRRDLDHPDVRFFFEQKIRVLAEQWAAERKAAVAETASEAAT